ncbi:MAG TPA: IclR family transcriptional regulator [Beijerinckiaceae bacterium]|nr:IclR family transcriptional regulator [Beijerinckiaceae bacterium]
MARSRVQASGADGRSGKSAGQPPLARPARAVEAPPAVSSRREAGPKRLSSVATAVRLLKSFSEGEAEIGITSLAKRLGVAKSTVYRLATTLVAEGMLEQNRENERYRLGIALFGLGALVRQRMNVSTEARPYLFDLREATNETVHLALLEGADILYVYDLESNQAIRMRANLGQRKPALATAEGRAMLAFLPDTLDEIIRRDAQSPKSFGDVSKLHATLEEVRREGFAREDQESEPGMRSVAAPIRNAAGMVVAAVGVAGPVQRLSDAVLATYGPQVVETANVISLRLGYKSLANF